MAEQRHETGRQALEGRHRQRSAHGRREGEHPLAHSEFLAHDRRNDLDGIGVPVLAATGGKGLQVSAADLAVICEFVAAPFDMHEITKLSHSSGTSGPASHSGYKRDVRLPIDSGLRDLVVRWVGAQAGVAA